MCIRDSAYTARSFLGFIRHAGILDVDSAEQIDQAIAIYKGCLLYTSDAADERSSVDLGGRRIIKKKTKAEVYMRETKS